MKNNYRKIEFIKLLLFQKSDRWRLKKIFEGGNNIDKPLSMGNKERYFMKENYPKGNRKTRKISKWFGPDSYHSD